jgi:Ni/Fe-hydrogenase subunit HybB-like protein
MIGIFGSQAQRAWQAYLINFLFWTGLAFGTVLFSTALTLAKGGWGRPLKRLAEAPGAFLPVAFVLFWVLFFGKEILFPWVLEPPHHKEVWLSAGFVFARDGASLLILTALALTLIYYSVRGDLKLAARGASGNWDVEEPSREGTGQTRTVLSVCYASLYAVLVSLIAFDLVMSLNPHWYSTLFGAYFFMGAFYSGLAAVMLLACLSVRTMGLGDFIHKKQFHDLGKLILAFCIVTGDFFYSQFVVIWYGNIPEETRHVILRIREAPWNSIAWTVLVVCYALPFAVLLSKSVKMKPGAMIALSAVILSGMWLERFLLIVPSIWKGTELPIGIIELLITAGFFGIMALCVLFFLKKFPMLPISDPLLRKSLQEAEG